MMDTNRCIKTFDQFRVSFSNVFGKSRMRFRDPHSVAVDALAPIMGLDAPPPTFQILPF